MNRSEIRVVKRQLEGYLDYLELARQQEAESMRLQELYERTAGAKCIPIDRNDVGRSTGLKSGPESRYLEIFSQQMEANEMAAKYRLKARQTRQFVKEVVEPLDKARAEYMRMAYLDGKQFSEISERIGCPVSNVRMGIDRALEQIPAVSAKTFGLL